MASETDIANLALQHLGESRIISLNDTSDKTSRACAVNFAQARDEALASARWSEAKTQKELSRLTEVPLYKWHSAFQLPTDFIRLTEINGGDAWMPHEYFDRLGDKLCIGRGSFDEAPATIIIEYIRREEDTTKFGPLLVESMAMLLAMKCARTLTGSDSKAQELRREYEQVVLPRAMTVNSQQIYSGKNHPIRSIMRRSLLNRARGFGGASNVGIKPW